VLLDDQVIDLNGFQVAGQTVSYQGEHCLAWRLDEDGRLLAFAGLACESIEVNGKEFRWSDRPVHVAWHPLSKEMETDHYRPLFRVWTAFGGVTNSVTRISLPLELDPTLRLEVWVGASVSLMRLPRGKPSIGGLTVGYGEQQIPFLVDQGSLVLDLKEEIEEHWLYVVERK
jgi:hypothetical protein